MKSDCAIAEGPAGAWATTMVAVDENMRMCLAVPLDSKMSSDEYMHGSSVQFVDKTLRHRAVRIQHDGEPAIKTLLSYVQVKRHHDTQDRCAPAYTSGANGLVETRIKQIQSQCRTLRLSLEGALPDRH